MLNIVTLASLAGCAAHAQETCPALNRARASVALGADAQLAVEWHAASDYICNYTAATGTIRVTVGPYHARDGWPAYTSQCFAASQPLSGVGDEAVACYSPEGQPQQGEVLAHVRDTFLTVRLTLTTGAGIQLREALRTAAERVAASLF